MVFLVWGAAWLVLLYLSYKLGLGRHLEGLVGKHVITSPLDINVVCSEEEDRITIRAIGSVN